MPQSCVAYGCTNRGTIDGVTYHSFPADEELRRQWVNAVKRAKWTPSKHSRLCSVHFREEDIDRTLVRVKLRDGAIPAIFPEFPNIKEQPGMKSKMVLLGDTKVTTEAHPSSPPSFKSPTEDKLKMKLDKTKSTLKKKNAKIKILQQSKRRLLKRVANLEDIICSLMMKRNIAEEPCSLLTSISKTSDCLANESSENTTNPTCSETNP